MGCKFESVYWLSLIHIYSMNNPNKKRLRRTMIFLNAQKPGLIKDPYIYKADSLMLDLEDAVAENQKDVARFSPVSYTHLMRLVMVVLPAPVEPTKAIFWPGRP